LEGRDVGYGGRRQKAQGNRAGRAGNIGGSCLGHDGCGQGAHPGDDFAGWICSSDSAYG